MAHFGVFLAARRPKEIDVHPSSARSLAESCLRIAAERVPSRVLDIGAFELCLAVGAHRAVIAIYPMSDGVGPPRLGSAGFAEPLQATDEAPALVRDLWRAGRPVVLDSIDWTSLGLAAAGDAAADGPGLLAAIIAPGGARGWICAARSPGGEALAIGDGGVTTALAIGGHTALAYAALTLASAARDTRSMYQALIEQIPAVTYYRPMEPGSPSFVSPQVEQMLGFTAHEVLADPELWRNRIHPDDVARVAQEQATYRPADLDRPIVSEYRLLHRDGHTVWVQNTAISVRDDNGRVRLVMGLLFDITDRRLSDAAERARDAGLRALVHANAVAMLTVDLRTSEVVGANQAGLLLTGRSAQELDEGFLFGDLIDAADRAATERRLDKVRADGVVPPWPVSLVGAAGAVPVMVASARVSRRGAHGVLLLIPVTFRSGS